MLSLAVERLRALPRARVDALSDIYLTEPQDYADQPWFHNQVVRMELETDWTPQSFVRALLAEEKQLGRQRSSDPALRFGPRCIDMDLLLFGDSQCDAPESIVPHPRMCQRAFVLIPLCDVGAACRIPRPYPGAMAGRARVSTGRSENFSVTRKNSYAILGCDKE